MADNSNSWWSTLPGILAGVAAVIAAIVPIVISLLGDRSETLDGQEGALRTSLSSENTGSTPNEPRHGSLRGQIQQPESDATVPRQFIVEGTIFGRHRRLWLIERIGAMHWPKEPELKPKDGKWTGEVNEGGYPPEGRFELLLVDVSDETASALLTWLQDGHRTGHYPGLRESQLGEFQILDTARYQLAVD